MPASTHDSKGRTSQRLQALACGPSCCDPTLAATANEASEAIRKSNREVMARFDVGPVILGRRSPGPKPKFSEARMDKLFFRVIDRVTGEKLKPYQKKFLKLIRKASSAVVR